MDPHAENYLSFSPYAYVGNNPIIYIDPDGRDRKLIYNHSNKTITVKATYYHNINSTRGARAGVNVFNNIKGATYTDSNGTTWAVNFNLSTRRSRDPVGDAYKDPQGNSFEVKNEVIDPVNGKKVAGFAADQKYTEVDRDYVDALTPAHEMGHTLGMDHAETGVMTTPSNHPNRDESITQENINQMIEQGKGPVEHRMSFWDMLKTIVNVLL